MTCKKKEVTLIKCLLCIKADYADIISFDPRNSLMKEMLLSLF